MRDRRELIEAIEAILQGMSYAQLVKVLSLLEGYEAGADPAQEAEIK